MNKALAILLALGVSLCLFQDVNAAAGANDDTCKANDVCDDAEDSCQDSDGAGTKKCLRKNDQACSASKKCNPHDSECDSGTSKCVIKFKSACTTSPALVCKAASSCLPGEDKKETCKEDKKLLGACDASAKACDAATNTECDLAATTKVCKCKKTHYASANADTCANTKVAVGATCTGTAGPDECAEGGCARQDDGTAKCQSGASFLQASLGLVVLTIFSALWTRC